MSRTRALAVLVLAGATAALGIGAAIGQGKPKAEEETWTTVFKSPVGIEGLTLDDDGNLYVPQRGGIAGCTIVRIAADGGANQPGVAVAKMNPPCNPAGVAFGPDGRLYLTGFGAAGDEIGVVTPSAADPANPPVATGFATGTPGANGIAFDEDGNLYVSDGGTSQGRVFRVGPSGGAAQELFRVPRMTNLFDIGRQNQALQPPAPPATVGIVANGLAFDKHGTLLVADTARGAIWQVELGKDGTLETPTGCDTTYPPNTLCHEALLVQHPALDGADGIALDRRGAIYVDANERNAVVVVDRRGRVSELFRNPVVANFRNAGPLEFPTSPVIAGRTFCTASFDINRRDNAPNAAGEAAPATAVVGKVSCLDQRVDDEGLELPVD
jgi:sugar lactone lactonase YvrE